MKIHDIENLRTDSEERAKIILPLFDETLTEYDFSIWLNAFRVVTKAVYLQLGEKDDPGNLILLSLVKDELDSLEKEFKN